MKRHANVGVRLARMRHRGATDGKMKKEIAKRLSTLESQSQDIDTYIAKQMDVRREEAKNCKEAHSASS